MASWLPSWRVPGAGPSRHWTVGLASVAADHSLEISAETVGRPPPGPSTTAEASYRSERGVQVPARGDVEFGVHLAQVPFHGVRAEEQLCADLGVGESRTGQLRDLRFLGGQRGRGGTSPLLGHGLAGGPQFAYGTFGERAGAESTEEGVRRTKLLTGIEAAVLPSQPLAVQ